VPSETLDLHERGRSRNEKDERKIDERDERKREESILVPMVHKDRKTG
jgi:hypothetical protein